MVLLEKTKKVIVTSLLLSNVIHLLPHETEAKIKEMPKEKKIGDDQPLRFGTKGQQVQTLQTYLRTFHFYQGTRDGIYGLQTFHAVSQFQQQNSLTVDGIAGPKTLTKLITTDLIDFPVKGQVTVPLIQEEKNEVHTVLISSSLEKNLTSTDALATSSILKTGSRGKAVKQLQLKLQSYGYYDGIDGIFGPKTKRAVIQYQKKHGLLVDGIAGPKTIGYLLNKTPSKKLQNKTENHQKEAEKKEEKQQAERSLISTAKTLKGSPYQWGGTSPSGFDCSGFLQYVFKKHNVQIPRTVRDIWNQASKVSKKRAGDIVFFSTYRSGPSHAGIFVGNNQFIHAGSSTGVTISDLNNPYWAPRYLGTKRIN